MQMRHGLIWSVLGALVLSSPAAGEKIPKQVKKLMAMTPVDFQRTATVKDDGLDTVAQISTQPGFQEKRGLLKMIWNDNFLRAFIDKKTGATQFQVYQYISYGGSWRFYQTANFETPSGPESTEVTVISRNVDSCMSYGCSFTEHIGFNVSEDLLRSIAVRYQASPGSIWRFKFGSKSGGDWQDGMATAEVAGILSAVDSYRASRGLVRQPSVEVAAQTPNPSPPSQPTAAEDGTSAGLPQPSPTGPKKKRPAVSCITCN